MTPILKVITEYCSLYVDDVRLSDLAVTNMPLYARRMYQYFKPAISLFTIPVGMQEYLLGNAVDSNFVEPTFDSTLYQVNDNYNSNFEINLGQDFTQYEIASCRVRNTDEGGTIILTPIPIEYDAETGKVTVVVDENNPILAGTILDFDFYSDGYFVENLSLAIMNILGLCFQVVWQDRFNTDWLSMVDKVEDKSFYEQNRANKIKSDTERLNQLRQKLASEMRRYEQNLFFRNVVNPSSAPKIK